MSLKGRPTWDDRFSQYGIKDKVSFWGFLLNGHQEAAGSFHPIHSSFMHHADWGMVIPVHGTFMVHNPIRMMHE